MMHLALPAPIHQAPFDRLWLLRRSKTDFAIATVDPDIAAYSVTLLPRA
jgi:PIN domain nuclease of toxin-antitoxin system